MWLLHTLLLMSLTFLIKDSSQNDLSEQLNTDISDLLNTIKSTMGEFEHRLEDLANHQLAQDLYTGEKIRNNGQSGIKLSRTYRGGIRPYDIPHHTGHRIAGFHNHANFKTVVGLGELVAVLNGVEFKTRHNDYNIVQPSTTRSDLLATEPIPPPPVPQEVLDQSSVEKEIIEMREWFKAWRDQDHSVRDYREHFKPLLCYLEGAWFYPDHIPVDMIHSDRHHIESTTFVHLLKKFKHTSDGGRKEPFENLAFLPRSVNRVVNGTPEFAQWNYRVLCVPLKDDLPLSKFRVVDDLAPRMAIRQSFEDYSASLRARYQLMPYDKDNDREGPAGYGLMDKLMAQVPGLDNYGGKLTDDSFGETAFEMSTEDGVPKPINSAYYNRWLMTETKGAAGLGYRHRGFTDDNLFVAHTTQSGVVPTYHEACTGKGRQKTCEWQEQRFTYAIPLEVVYMTPLSEWNPYDIEYKGDKEDPRWEFVRKGGRDGRTTLPRAYNGTNHVTFFQTPSEFFSGSETSTDPADTTGRGTTAVLDRNGEIKMMRDSGYRIQFPEIAGVGVLRQRYPIMSIHGEGGSVWKELEALKDIVLDFTDNQAMFRQVPMLDTTDIPNPTTTLTPTPNPSTSPNPTSNPNDLILRLEAGTADHSHLVVVNSAQLLSLRNGTTVDTTTQETDSHSHTLTIRLREGQNDVYLASIIRPPHGHPNKMAIVQDPQNTD